MSRLETILSGYAVDGRLGRRSFDREYLRQSLAAAGRQTSLAFWAAVAAQVAMFVLVAWFAIANSGNPRVLAWVLAGGGGGVGACAWGAVRLWKEKVSTDLTLALVGSLDEEAASTVLSVVLDTLRGTRDRRPAGGKANRSKAIPQA